MTRSLIPQKFFSFPSLRFPLSLLGEEEEGFPLEPFSEASGLSVYEDEGHVHVEAALPGIDPKEVEMTYDKGVLWIRAEKKEEEKDKNKKFYRKASTSFSYRLALPGNIDEEKEPVAEVKNGVVKVTFDKHKKAQPKKITLK